MVMILTMRAFFLLSLFAFLGTRARTLPELHDKFNISNTNYGRTSSPALPSPTSSQPSKHLSSVAPFTSKSLGNGVVQTIPSSSYVEMTRKETTNGLRPKSPPPPPYIAPPHIQITSTSGIAYDKVTKMGRFNGAKPKESPPPPPYIAPPHIQITSTSGIAYDKVTKMGRLNGAKPKESPPPAPYIAPPHGQITITSCVSGSSCNKVRAASSSGLGAI